jgi:hypothetical protein
MRSIVIRTKKVGGYGNSLYLDLDEFQTIFTDPKINIILGRLASPIARGFKEQYQFKLTKWIRIPDNFIKRRSVCLVSKNPT